MHLKYEGRVKTFFFKIWTTQTNRSDAEKLRKSYIPAQLLFYSMLTDFFNTPAVIGVISSVIVIRWEEWASFDSLEYP